MRTMERLIFLRKDPLAAAVIVCLFAVGLIGLPYENVGALLSNDPLKASLSGMIVCRAAGLAAMLFLHRLIGFSSGLRLRKGALLSLLPALLVAVNNAPLIALFSGSAGVTAGAEQVILFALACVFVASFEELTFRGIVFPLLLSHFGAGKRERTAAVLASSLLFGLMHLVNLVSGGVGETFLQAGYTFLIGAMFAVVLLCTGILPCASSCIPSIISAGCSFRHWDTDRFSIFGASPPLPSRRSSAPRRSYFISSRCCGSPTTAQNGCIASPQGSGSC